MSLEQKINYQLNKVPALKRLVKSVYQHIMYVVSPKIKSEGGITRVSPDDPAHEYFFGYYDKSPWDISGRYMLCMRAADTWSDVSPKQKADIIMIDTEKAEGDSGRVTKLAETSSWNVQQGCMLQWLGTDFSKKILYNDCRNGKYVSVILDIFTKEERVINAPAYTVSNDGKTALTLDFSRLYNLRPGYGYYNVPERTKGEALPDAPAVWRTDLESGAVTELLTYKDFAEFEPRREMLENGAVHKVNHLMLSPDGTRFMVLYRWFVGERKYTRLITCGTDGKDMYLLSDDDMVSHCCWKDNTHILAFENKKSEGIGYYLMTDKTQEYSRCWRELDSDGHPGYAPDGTIVTDTYPDRARIQYLRIMDGENSSPRVAAKVFSPFKYDNDTRCDLHPRFDRTGSKICFDSVFEGHRGLYTVNLPKKTSEKAPQTALISVITPVYNAEKYIERSVDSVLKQTYKNIEIILVNDGSTDSSLAVCRRLAEKYPQITVIDKKNGGSGSARNAGLRAARGEYIGFVDSDDWVTPDYYEYMMNLLTANDADVVDVGVAQVKSPEERVPDGGSVAIYDGNEILRHYLLRGMSEQGGAPFSACRKLYRAEVFAGDAAWFPEGTVNEDICFNYRLLQKCGRAVVSECVKYFYFQGKVSVSNGALKRRDMALIKVSRELVDLARSSGDAGIIELAEMKLARSYFSLLARAAKFGTDSASVSDPEKLAKKLQRGLRKSLPLLMRSPMSRSRKILAAAFAVNYKLSCKMIRALKL